MQKTVSIDEKNVWPFFKNPSKNVLICSIAITELVQVHHFYNCWMYVIKFVHLIVTIVTSFLLWAL